MLEDLGGIRYKTPRKIWSLALGGYNWFEARALTENRILATHWAAEQISPPLWEFTGGERQLVCLFQVILCGHISGLWRHIWVSYEFLGNTILATFWDCPTVHELVLSSFTSKRAEVSKGYHKGAAGWHFCMFWLLFLGPQGSQCWGMVKSTGSMDSSKPRNSLLPHWTVLGKWANKEVWIIGLS